MRFKSLISKIIALLIFSSCSTQQSENIILFDNNWKFSLGDSPDAIQPEFNDSTWRTLNLPHDYSIEQPFDSLNNTGKEGGYAYSGIAWYRKTFALDKTQKSKRILIQFDGVYRNSDVWINGHHLGFWPYGYTSFYYNLTPYLNKNGEKNHLVVKVNTSAQPNSRWYTGAGIYRHVYLITTGKVHFKHWGVFAQSTKVEKQKAEILVNVELKNDGNSKTSSKIITVLKDQNDNTIASTTDEVILENGEEKELKQSLSVTNPILWSIENPYLYKLESKLISGDIIEDIFTTNYGIRKISFDPDSGVYLNGKSVKLKGTNNHHDGGPLGAACMDHTFYRQLRKLKNMGCNALRISHNPPSPQLLNCTDSMGFLVINEIFDEWKDGKRKDGYGSYFDEWYEKDITNWIRRDRNHTSVMAWSLGNEVPEQRNANSGPELLKKLIQTAQKSDTTRPFTAGCNEIPSANASGMASLLDIVGYNYREPYYDEDHKKYSGRVIYGSETTIYPYQPGASFPLHTYKQWVNGQLNDYVAGEFLWTGFDYIGETGIGLGGTELEPWNYWPEWPYRSAVCGVIDICGFEKPGYWFRKSLWSNEPMVYIAVETDKSAKNTQKVPFWGWPEVWPHWNHKIPGESLMVHVYTNCTEVELFVNNKSFGTKFFDLNKQAFLTWEVPFTSGEIKAVGRTKNNNTTQFALKSAQKPAKIILSGSRNTMSPSNQEITYIEAHIVDENNIPCPFYDEMINFTLSGAGILKAVGNGNPKSHTPFTGNKMEAWHGKCLAIVQSNGKSGSIKLIAEAMGLKNAELLIEVK